MVWRIEIGVKLDRPVPPRHQSPRLSTSTRHGAG